MWNLQDASITPGAAPSARVTIQLDAPTARIQIRDPRRLGRAQALFAGQNWAAKHHWAEGVDNDRVTTYEFDEALPAGGVELIIPLE